jgi:hypothetical protein
METKRPSSSRKISTEDLEYERAIKKLNIWERRFKLILGAIFIGVPFTYAYLRVIFGWPDVPFRTIAPFEVIGFITLFQLKFRDALVLVMGNLGILFTKISASLPEGEGDSKEDTA